MGRFSRRLWRRRGGESELSPGSAAYGPRAVTTEPRAQDPAHGGQRRSGPLSWAEPSKWRTCKVLWVLGTLKEPPKWELKTPSHTKEAELWQEKRSAPLVPHLILKKQEKNGEQLPDREGERFLKQFQQTKAANRNSPPDPVGRQWLKKQERKDTRGSKRLRKEARKEQRRRPRWEGEPWLQTGRAASRGRRKGAGRDADWRGSSPGTRRRCSEGSWGLCCRKKRPFLHPSLKKTNHGTAPNRGKQKARGAMFQKTPLRCPGHSPLGSSTSCEVTFATV